MSGLNRVQLIGRLGADPELRYTQSGAGVCKLRMVTSESVKGRDGQWETKDEWHDVIIWGKLADRCGHSLKKGMMVFVEGRLTHRQYEKDGAKRYVTEVTAKDVQWFSAGASGPADGNRRDDAGEPHFAPPPAGGRPGGNAPSSDKYRNNGNVGNRRGEYAPLPPEEANDELPPWL